MTILRPEKHFGKYSNLIDDAMSAQLDTHPSTPERIIRRLDDSDLSEVMVIEQASYDFPWSQGIFRDCLRAGYACYAMTEADVLQGYAIVSSALDEAHVLNLCIRPQDRRRGLACTLLDHVLAEASVMGVDRCFLEVRPSNKPARRLYQQFGFRVIGRRPGYYPSAEGREDAWVMLCHLCDRPPFPLADR